MKFVLYFHFYILNHESLPITTNMVISEDSLSFYVYDLGYIKWKIDEKHKEILENKKISYGIYFVSFKDIKAIIHISLRSTHIVILTGEKHQIIDLKE